MHLLHLWAFVACSRMNFTLTFTLPYPNSAFSPFRLHFTQINQFYNTFSASERPSICYVDLTCKLTKLRASYEVPC
jgi:hypothetical protein